MKVLHFHLQKNIIKFFLNDGSNITISYKGDFVRGNKDHLEFVSNFVDNL